MPERELDKWSTASWPVAEEKLRLSRIIGMAAPRLAFTSRQIFWLTFSRDLMLSVSSSLDVKTIGAFSVLLLFVGLLVSPGVSLGSSGVLRSIANSCWGQRSDNLFFLVCGKVSPQGSSQGSPPGDSPGGHSPRGLPAVKTCIVVISCWGTDPETMLDR